ncbi:hypothetical protein NQ314_011461 [Rhamnusium bicolor]|uniref:Uncharacterized protein n=1 Tax=Rhamnusium bicolor TaxID=1586634 RepID=A0AAV8XKJ0_9CUCU|nr:hypothetical protein NQ314_011461 [Rhamnusium bicolor]
MADEDSSRSFSESESDLDSDQGLPQNYTIFLQSLINRLTDVYCISSEFSLITKQSSGLVDSKRKVVSPQKNITKMLLNRERGLYTSNSFSHGNKCKISNRYLPNDMSVMDGCAGKVFCGIFSNNGNCFITASQDRHIRLYNSGDGSYKLFKSLRARDVGWSIIDVAFSPDREHFVYSTWSSSLHLCPVNGNTEHQEPLSLLNTGRRFCVFSVVFSSDGRELLGGANDGCLYIYDQQRHGRTLKIPAHEYDVNSVVFADDSSHIIYSGGDDGLIKVWDRRTLDGALQKLLGDSRHLISNSKDQSIKLWDVRVFSGEKAAEKSLKAVHEQTWDYRWQEVPRKLYTSRSKLEGDTSVMTYRGHVVIKTLVRCRFSPLETTGQRYIYTGCGVGRVVSTGMGWWENGPTLTKRLWEKPKNGSWKKIISYKSSQPVRRSLRLALKKEKRNNLGYG